jgi:two-component system, NarL family, invasion response regulator UvrY
LKSVLIVDDHPVIAKACQLVLEPLGIENVVSASTVDAGYEAFVEHEPEVSVIDLTLHKDQLAGIALIKRILAYAPAANVLVFSMRSDRNSFFTAIEAGASGYVIKDSPTQEFTKAVEEVRSGRRYIDTQLALNLSFSRNAALSPREQRIIHLLRDTPVKREVGLQC